MTLPWSSSCVVHVSLVPRTRGFSFSLARWHWADHFVPGFHTKVLHLVLLLCGFSAFAAVLHAALFQDPGLELPHGEAGDFSLAPYM